MHSVKNVQGPISPLENKGIDIKDANMHGRSHLFEEFAISGLRHCRMRRQQKRAHALAMQWTYDNYSLE
jgi:hypothetical protein